VLEASYVLYRLRPHHANFRKRLVKSPKIYFYDTGLLCWLLARVPSAACHSAACQGLNLFLFCYILK